MWILAAGLFTTGLLLTYHMLIRPLLHQPLKDIPGPLINKFSSIPLAVCGIFLRRNDKIWEWHQKYGPIVCISPNEVSVATMDATREIYSTASRYDKSSYFDHFKGYGNDYSIFATKLYDEHKKKRKLTFSFYQASTVYTKTLMEEGIRENVHSVLEYISKSNEQKAADTWCLDVYSCTDWYAFDNITRLVLGPVHCSQAIEGDPDQRRILKNLKHCQLWGPFRVRFLWAFQTIAFLCSYTQLGVLLRAEIELAKWCRGRTRKVFRDIKANKADYYSLIHSLISQESRHKELLGDFSLASDFIEAEVLDNINAAEATVSVTATYAIYHLSKDVEWQNRVRNELLRLPREPDGLPTFANINKAPVLNACLMEVYRLQPAVSGRAERVIPDDGKFISGVYLPAKVFAKKFHILNIHSLGNIF